MNPAKTKVSFDMSMGGQALPRNTYTADNGQEYLKWCGLLVNVRTLELQADYTRYAGTRLAASLTIPLTKVELRFKGYSHLCLALLMHISALQRLSVTYCWPIS